MSNCLLDFRLLKPHLCSVLLTEYCLFLADLLLLGSKVCLEQPMSSDFLLDEHTTVVMVVYDLLNVVNEAEVSLFPLLHTLQ